MPSCLPLSQSVSSLSNSLLGTVDEIHGVVFFVFIQTKLQSWNGLIIRYWTGTCLLWISTIILSILPARNFFQNDCSNVIVPRINTCYFMVGPLLSTSLDYCWTPNSTIVNPLKTLMLKRSSLYFSFCGNEWSFMKPEKKSKINT